MSRFHQSLYELVLREKPNVMVETGYATGLSAMHILAAMDINGVGTLYSVESFTFQDIFHPRLRYKRGLSTDVLPEILGQLEPTWDMFLHDSDHGYACQTFEFNFAWTALRPGGILITDDFEWYEKGKPHYAWRDFLAVNPHTDLTTIGSAQWARKI